MYSLVFYSVALLFRNVVSIWSLEIDWIPWNFRHLTIAVFYRHSVFFSFYWSNVSFFTQKWIIFIILLHLATSLNVLHNHNRAPSQNEFRQDKFQWYLKYVILKKFLWDWKKLLHNLYRYFLPKKELCKLCFRKKSFIFVSHKWSKMEIKI